MMPFFKDFAQSTVYKSSKGADSMIPWFMSSLGYGFLWNLPSYGNVSITPAKTTWCSSASLNVDFWITTTPAGTSTSSYPSLLHQFVSAVGHAPAMPGYATGFIQSKNRYRSQDQLLEVAREYKARHLPISVIVIDFYHWRHQGDWSFDPACWPDPQAMVQELESLDIQVMVTFWPFQTPSSSPWQEFSSSGFLASLTNGSLAPFDWGDQYLYDPFSQEGHFRWVPSWLRKVWHENCLAGRSGAGATLSGHRGHFPVLRRH
jgi:alpha-D-xyloside xylohydrolase